jgi:DNA-binding NarL/FixJ family response regulator
MKAFRILLADDHPVFRMGVNSLIRSHQEWQVCGEAADGRELITKCAQLRPDLLILDICMPNLYAEAQWRRGGNAHSKTQAGTEDHGSHHGGVRAGYPGTACKQACAGGSSSQTERMSSMRQ